MRASPRTMAFAAMLVLTFAAGAARAAVTFDGALTSSTQILSASNSPFFGAGNTQDLVGVNFHYSAGNTVPAGATVSGVKFDNVNFTGTNPPAGPFALPSNGSAATLAVNAPWGGADNTLRNQFTAIGGADGATLGIVANQIFYVGFVGCCHESIDLNFANLGASRNVHVQIIGGDEGWTGDLGVTANGSSVGTWTSVADGNAATASLFSFNTTTNAAGNLNLNFGIVASNFAGIGGIVITGEGILAPPPPPVFAQVNLTSTAQILAPDADHTLLGAINLFYPGAQAGVAAPGTVNGIPFQNIAWNNGSAQALTLGGTVTISPALASRERFQNTAATITGPDEIVLESIANTINFLGAGEQVSINFANLPADQNVRVQVIGGDAGTTFDNWLGDFEITANGLVIGTWDIVADDDQFTASLATFLAATDASGALNLTFRQINGPPGQFAGIAGLVVTTAPGAVPEPGTLSLLGLAALGLLRRRRAA